MSEAYVISNKDLPGWLDSLTKTYDVFAPVRDRRNRVVFKKISDASNVAMNYRSTMLAPRQFIYPSHQTLFQIDRKTCSYQTPSSESINQRLIFAVHPCDMHAISVLDRIFLGDVKDSYYSQLREKTLTVVLNCNQACDKGFCLSMGAGPFLQLKDGFDLVLTAMQDDYLVESGSEKAEALVNMAGNLRKVKEKDLAEKKNIKTRAEQSFTKQLDTKGLPELLMNNLDHPVYERTAEARCLGCTNCTMVCPTCYCYNIKDDTSYDLKSTTRKRYWDSCQELNFARVHEGNFRSSRQARLRQFVIHKLATWVEQYGCFGCVGCGRCMTWCPTKIDLTDMAKEIQQHAKTGKAK